jgi:hypothetical protein
MEMGRGKAGIKVPKLVKIYSTIKKGWRPRWKAVGVGPDGGGITTNDNGGYDTSSLNNAVHIQG